MCRRHADVGLEGFTREAQQELASVFRGHTKPAL
jgi:hypothetical protein